MFEIFSRTPDKPARKQNLTRNSHSISKSFKVMHFEITEKPTTGCMSLCNNAGLIISKVSKEISNKSADNCPSWQLHCHLTPPPREPPRMSTQTLYCQNVESLGYILAVRMSLSSFKFLWWASFLQ